MTLPPLAAPPDRGAVAIVLHSHMPYVEGFGTWPFGEEWLWEAIATAYLPLLEVLDGAPVTVGLTPVLCDQLEVLCDEEGDRYLRYLRDVRTAVHEGDAAALDRDGQAELAAEVRRAGGDYATADASFERRACDLVGAFAGLAGVELWTSTASHAVLPLVATDAGRRLQLATGVASHERRFGEFGGGLWIPECAYEPGLERELSEHGVRAFCVDQTEAHGLGAPEHLEPVATAPGPVAVPIDWQTVQLVWSERAGYPGRPSYRDYYGRTKHDVKAWSNAGEPYRQADGLALAREHARDFVERAAARLDAYSAERGRAGLLTCALDTELLGHWWYEGPAWLAAVLEEAPARGVELVTVSDGLERVPPVERPLRASSWGRGKDLSTWDSPEVAEMAFAARAAELRTVAAAARGGGHRALERAARELLALQASDWAFQVAREQAGDYPRERVRGHAAGLEAALAGADVEPALRGLAPDLELASLLSP